VRLRKVIKKLKLHFIRYGILEMVFSTIIFQLILAFRTCRTLPPFLSENLHKNGQVIVQNTNILFQIIYVAFLVCRNTASQGCL